VTLIPRPELRAQVRRTLLELARRAGRYGIEPIEGFPGRNPWTAATASAAWALARLGERRAADRLLAALRRSATEAWLLPERVDAETGVPVSTPPLAWSHAFAILALLERYGNAQA
jgi:GH15 family glucan-1,4-alpha-glucosidase